MARTMRWSAGASSLSGSHDEVERVARRCWVARTMRWSAWLVVAGCGASTPRPAPAPALDEPSSPAPPATTAEATILADRGCIAAGTYAVLVDLSGAEVVTTGASGRDVC